MEFQMGVRNEVVQSVGKGQVHADSLSLAPSPFIFFPPVPLHAHPHPPPPTSRVPRQSGKRLLFLLLLLVTTFKYSTENTRHLFFFFPSTQQAIGVTCCNLIWPANSPVMSCTASDNSGREGAGGHYLSRLTLPESAA